MRTPKTAEVRITGARGNSEIVHLVYSFSIFAMVYSIQTEFD